MNVVSVFTSVKLTLTVTYQSWICTHSCKEIQREGFVLHPNSRGEDAKYLLFSIIGSQMFGSMPVSYRFVVFQSSCCFVDHVASLEFLVLVRQIRISKLKDLVAIVAFIGGRYS